MLRNAFDNLGTEAALRRIANLLTFARDQQDRIRVTLDTNNANNIVYNRGSSTTQQGTDSPLPFSALTWNAMDARETQKNAMRTNSELIKRNRWTF
jgi:hypothetical protein